MVIFAYRGRQLVTNASCLMPFGEAEISVAANVKESSSGSETMVSFKNRKPLNYTMTVQLLASAGVDVKAEVKGWQGLVDGKAGRVYIGGEDYFGRDMILTECTAAETRFSGQTMTAAKLKLVFQQAGEEKKKKAGGSTSSGTHSKYHTYAEAWAVNATTKKKTRITTIKDGKRAAGDNYTLPTAPTGYIAPTEYKVIQYAMASCPFCKEEAALAAKQAAEAAQNASENTGFDSAFKPGTGSGQ